MGIFKILNYVWLNYQSYGVLPIAFNLKNFFLTEITDLSLYILHAQNLVLSNNNNKHTHAYLL